MICIVLAAGYATRMYPLTENYPKPLLAVQDKPILNWLLEDVDGIAGIEKVIVVSNHKFIIHFEDWKEQQHFSKPLVLLDDGSTSNETRVGAVRDIEIALDAVSKPDSEALVIAGDNVLEFSFKGFVDYFHSLKHSCIMCYTESDVIRQRKTGIITINVHRRVTSFEEKPTDPKSDLAVPPFYCYTVGDLKRIPEAIKAGCSTDAPGSLAAWLCAHSRVYAWKMPGKRYDIGDMDTYTRVQNIYKGVQNA